MALRVTTFVQYSSFTSSDEYNCGKLAPPRIRYYVQYSNSGASWIQPEIEGKILLKIVRDPDHPVTSCLAKNPRSTTVYNLYKTNIAKTEAHNQTFVLKYLRLIRDKRQEQKHNKNIKRLTNPKPATTKIKQPPILCQQCGISIKNKTGLSAHLRLNKKCNSTLVSAEIISSQNITLRR